MTGLAAAGVALIVMGGLVALAEFLGPPPAARQPMKYDLRDEIDALKRRIEELERRPVYVPVYVPVPVPALPAPAQPYVPVPPFPKHWPPIMVI